jgi:hypothetical protein
LSDMEDSGDWRRVGCYDCDPALRFTGFVALRCHR